jgi:hypothetical protein
MALVPTVTAWIAPSAAGAATFYGSAGGTALATVITGMASSPSGHGYWLLESDGQVHAFGDAGNYGSAMDTVLPGPFVALVPTPSGAGYWMVASDGRVVGAGDAPSLGSVPAGRDPVVSASATPTGRGLFLAGRGGSIYTLGDARYAGNPGGVIGAPVVSVAADAASGGYWVATANGGVYGFGGARFAGSVAGRPLAAPIVGMATRHDGQGYWLVASDGGIFAFGASVFMGSTGGFPLNQPITGMAATPAGDGYWLVARDGGIFNFPGPPIGPFSFLAIDAATRRPVRYNPCQPLHVRVNLTHAPPGGLRDLGQVLREVSAATGITIILDGTTGEVPQTNRGLTNPGYGPGFAPVVVDWAEPGETGYPLKPGNLGYGGSAWVANAASQPVFVTGAVVINAAAGLPAGFAPAGQESDGKVLLHELGHVVGLGHATTGSEIMNPDPGQGPDSYGQGDLAGLSRLGVQAGCLAEPPGTGPAAGGANSAGQVIG